MVQHVVVTPGREPRVLKAEEEVFPAEDRGSVWCFSFELCCALLAYQHGSGARTFCSKAVSCLL